MKSDGGFGKHHSAQAAELLLSGPAGGLVGYAQLINRFEAALERPIQCNCLTDLGMIGVDMGGTSTDVSKLRDHKLTLTYSLELENLCVCAPSLVIDTIAAGGGSKLTFCAGLFQVGPSSVGSDPGPVCYGKGSTLFFKA